MGPVGKKREEMAVWLKNLCGKLSFPFWLVLLMYDCSELCVHCLSFALPMCLSPGFLAVSVAE